MWSYHIVPILCRCQPSCGCPNKLSKTGWTQATEIHFLTFLEVRSSKSLSLGQNQGVPQPPPHPLEASEDNLFLVPFSFWWLLALLGLWPHHSSFCHGGHIAFSSSGCIKSPCALLISVYIWLHVEPTWISSHLRILNTSAKLFYFLSYKLTSTDFRN